ncbi:HNH endonuclease [Tenacibaculum jejuense]|uniref:HNH nuclease domain-containing protein n=1 Tax=Tenacibaculum jejuense TaxID=584609 RepID=A0A238U508_9FLAO|nr:HNH endonuclease signature motif containing protein [Tenacibaculum jejuense]SNR14283.1 conserved protein of unknown function [Tenacibaculum jejuense]
MKYYWVNQGKTYKEEKEGKYLWAPVKNNKEQTFFHWNNMTKLKPNDIVFNYRKGFIIGYCQIKSHYFLASQPEEFNVDAEWENEGYMVDADYVLFSSPLNVKNIYKKIKDHLPEKYSPLNSKTEANQGYLYEINEKIAFLLFNFGKIKYKVVEKEFGNLSEEETLDYQLQETSRINLTTSRIGQGKFRQKILKKWNYKCAVSKVSVKEILIASHIIPWREANNFERLDVNNGILLSPVYDALFDKHLISFKDDGTIVISKHLKESEYSKLGITGNEKILELTPGNRKYLKSHRNKLYKI